jgi:hypothetical protein
LADPDPWHGLVWTIERNLELQATDRGLSQLVHDSPQGLERIVRVRERLLPIGRDLIVRAQAAGAVRADIETGDLPIIQLMVSLVLEASHDVDPELWRRYLALALRGIATHPEDLPALPGPAPTPEAIDRVMTARPARRR